jgi:exonuclease SbcD
MPSIRLLHFADAHIDMANYGAHDPESMLPVRVTDFLRALDQIIDRAIAEAVDLVVFAGDAYKDRNPQPTFQREWGARIMRLSRAGIPTILLVGNHDVSPAAGRAHTVQEFATLSVPHVLVADRIQRFGPDELGLPVQVIAVPWISRSALLTRQESAGKSADEIQTEIEERVANAIAGLLDEADPGLPLILTAHASVQGATYGSEQTVMLGRELTLSGAVIRDPRIDYVALGHIHRHQSLNGESHPPAVYPGSIERIDFGEAGERKGFVLADVDRGATQWQFVPVETLPFLDFSLDTPDGDTFMADVMRQLPAPERVAGAICRVQLSYPRAWEPLVDEAAIFDHFRDALSLQLVKRTVTGNRARLGDTVDVESMGPVELLDQYWRTVGLDEEEAEAMRTLAREVLATELA